MIVTRFGDRNHRAAAPDGIEKDNQREDSVAESPLNPLQVDLWQALQGLKAARVEPRGEPLFRQGQPSRGIYLVEEGEVRLLLAPDSNAGQAFEVAGPGAVLGLSEAMSGGDYKLTAEAAAGARISYVDRNSFLQFLRKNHSVCLQIVRLLSEDLHSLYYRCRCIAQAGGSGPN